jgi:outer membrane protein OmpA-like peptidoglycan-associated protein
MFRKIVVLGIAALLLCVKPVMAQERGTVEFGAFVSSASFDHSLSLLTARGIGGRVGVFLDPRWSLEFDDAEMRATRPAGLKDVNVGILSGRLVNTPVKAGPLSILLGVGAGASTETNFLHSYGVNALAGVKLDLWSAAALRVDAQEDFLANYSWKRFTTIRAGLSFYRHPTRVVKTVVVDHPAKIVQKTVHDTVQVHDSVLVDRPVRIAPIVVDQKIYFAFDKSDLSDSAQAVLKDKIAVLQAHPTVRILIVGNTDVKGSDTYNLALGFRRAKAAKAFLVAQGIDESRIDVASSGKGALVSSTNQDLNRRDEFRVIILQEK